jgi:GntR family transcriptional regulator
VDRRSPVPLWAQIFDDLRRRLSAGEFDDKFPSDVELVAEYDVSRHTVREAVRHLQSEDLLERARGRGSFVRQKPLEAALGTLYSLYRAAEEQGFVQDSEVRFLEERSDAEAAAVLGCDGEEPLVYLERLRLINAKPVVLDCSWLPKRIAGPLLGADFRRTALYRELESRCGIRPDSGWERLRPVMPTSEQKSLLGLSRRVPVFSFERLACQGDVRVEWRHGVIRADRFEFVARWGEGRMKTAFERTDGA